MVRRDHEGSTCATGPYCAFSPIKGVKGSWVPLQMLLFGFTITEGVLVGVICSNYTLVSVLVLYTGTTKTDITGIGGYPLAAAVVHMIFGISCIP